MQRSAVKVADTVAAAAAAANNNKCTSPRHTANTPNRHQSIRNPQNATQLGSPNHSTSSQANSNVNPQSVAGASASTPSSRLFGAMIDNLTSTAQDYKTSAMDITRGIQAGRLHYNPETGQLIDSISIEFFYKPHTLTAFLILLSLLIYFTFHFQENTETLHNIRLGLFVVALFILLLGLLVFPSGPFIRPHPLFWRLSFGCAVCYEVVLIMILFQNKSDARKGLTLFYDSLGVPLAEKTYGEACQVNINNLLSAMDLFVIGHFLGWVIKALILRDTLICWVISIEWELIEICFTHMLPNFGECWWDQWILDVLLSNGLGIYVGSKLCQFLELREYKWSSYREIPTLIGKFKRSILQFTPADWTIVRWEKTKTIRRFFGIQMLVLAFHVAELNAFFLKYLLWIPPPNNLNMMRLAVWSFLGVPSIRQIYSYMSNEHCHTIGTHAFLAMVIMSTELCIIFKFSPNEFTKRMPQAVQTGLKIAAVIYALVCCAVVLQIRQRSKMPSKETAAKEGHLTVLPPIKTD